MSNRRSRLSRTKATESIGPARIFRRRVVRKSSALACIRGRPGFLPARSDLIVKILVCCRQMGSYPETLVLYRTGPAVSVPGDSGKSGGARPIQLFEGSRPGGSIYANSMVLGI